MDEAADSELDILLGLRLRAARSRLGWTLDALAQRTGVSRAMIYKSMKRRSAPFPKPVKIGAVSRWPIEDVEAWVIELRSARGRSR